MTILFVQTEDKKLVDDFFKQVHKNLQSTNLFKNAFKGKVKRLGSGFFILEMNPVISPFNLPGWALKYYVRKGLKKINYFGFVTFVSKDDAIRRLLRWDK